MGSFVFLVVFSFMIWVMVAWVDENSLSYSHDIFFFCVLYLKIFKSLSHLL
jgi:hypothetical protein